MHIRLLFAVLLTLRSAKSQLPLPSPPYLPPDSSFGVRRATDRSTNSSTSPNAHWTTLLGNLLYFYDAQRSGQLLTEQNRVPWRNTSALDDGKDVGVDLTGGFYDAGDYIKATFPFSFTLMSLCWGAADFGQGYEKANQTAYLDSTLRWGLDWLMKAHPNNNTLYVQVGSTEIDNDYWGGDRNIPTPRPSFQINETHPGTDASAQASAAFSACAALYSNRTYSSPFSARAKLQNQTYASTLLQHAQALDAFAQRTEPSQRNYQVSVPEVASAYGSNAYTDELVISSLFLAIATNDSTRYSRAASMYEQYQLAGGNPVFNWDSKGPGIAVLFAQANSAGVGNASDADKWRLEAERYFDNIIAAKGPGYMTPGGLLFYDGDSDSASLNPALNAAMLMIRFSSLVSTDIKKTAYLDFAQSQIDYALGDNPMHVPYIVGSNPNSPSNPHSAMASGGNNIDNIDEGATMRILFGAVVGGPDSEDKFFDIRSDWPETEVALDYNAPLLTICAWAVANFGNSTDDDPFYTKLQDGEYEKVKPAGMPCDEVFSCQHPPHLSLARTIAMAVVISVVGLIIVSLIIWYLWLCVSQKKA